MVGTPTPRTDEAKKLVYLNIDIDEGKPFYVSRIEFTGNTITRDKVIRREMLIEEGQVYNSRLVDLSLLRLNQLNYFDTLKTEQDVETRQNADAGTVDLLIKLKEKGKNSIGLNGWRQRSVRFVRRLELRDQQLPRPRRNAERKRQHRRPLAQPEPRLQRALPAQQAGFARRAGVHEQVRLQPGEELRDRQRPEREPDQRAELAAEQLQPVDDRPYGFHQHGAAQAVPPFGCSACRPFVLAIAFGHHYLQPEHAERLPDAGVPLRHRRPEPA